MAVVWFAVETRASVDEIARQRQRAAVDAISMQSGDNDVYQLMKTLKAGIFTAGTRNRIYVAARQTHPSVHLT